MRKTTVSASLPWQLVLRLEEIRSSGTLTPKLDYAHIEQLTHTKPGRTAWDQKLRPNVSWDTLVEEWLSRAQDPAHVGAAAAQAVTDYINKVRQSRQADNMSYVIETLLLRGLETIEQKPLHEQVAGAPVNAGQAKTKRASKSSRDLVEAKPAARRSRATHQP